MDKSTSLLEIKREIEEVQEQISSVSVKILIKKEENEEYRNVITGTLYYLLSISYKITLRMERTDKSGSQRGLSVQGVGYR